MSGNSRAVVTMETEDFHCEESERFWLDVKPCGPSENKSWKEFRRHLNATFPDDPLFGERKSCQALRFLSLFLKTRGRNCDAIHVTDYANVLAWFGPMRVDHEGRCVCLAQIAELVRSSTQLNDTGTELKSWFAGFVTKDEANAALSNQDYGTFLVRFSESEADCGTFCLAAVVHEGQRPIHVKIRGDPKRAAQEGIYHAHLEFNDEEFPHVVDVVQHLRQTPPLVTPSASHLACRRICPFLPLNAEFTGYETIGAAVGGVGLRRVAASPGEELAFGFFHRVATRNSRASVGEASEHTSLPVEHECSLSD